eukprot:1362222-Pyramimonas_sp.AAC.1
MSISRMACNRSIYSPEFLLRILSVCFPASSRPTPSSMKRRRQRLLRSKPSEARRSKTWCMRAA